MPEPGVPGSTTWTATSWPGASSRRAVVITRSSAQTPQGPIPTMATRSKAARLPCLGFPAQRTRRGPKIFRRRQNLHVDCVTDDVVLVRANDDLPNRSARTPHPTLELPLCIVPADSCSTGVPQRGGPDVQRNWTTRCTPRSLIRRHSRNSPHRLSPSATTPRGRTKVPRCSAPSLRRPDQRLSPYGRPGPGCRRRR